MDSRIAAFEEKMQKTMQNLSGEFGSIRAGRAPAESPEMG